MENFYSIGQRIKIARKISGLKQKELANKIGISEKTMVNYEANDTSIPAVKLKEIAINCGVSEDWLFSGRAKNFIEYITKYLFDLANTWQRELVEDIIDDEKFPRSETNLDSIKSYLEFRTPANKWNYSKHFVDEILTEYKDYILPARVAKNETSKDSANIHQENSLNATAKNYQSGGGEIKVNDNKPVYTNPQDQLNLMQQLLDSQKRLLDMQDNEIKKLNSKIQELESTIVKLQSEKGKS